jgi:hypothetical protein
MQTALLLSSLGERMNLQLQQGATFGPIVATMNNPDASPVNLTGCTIFGSIRKAATPDVIAAAITVAITAPLTGNYNFLVTATATDALTAGDSLQASDSQYVWDLFLKDAAARVLPLYTGVCQVLRRVSKPTPP